MAKPFSAQFVVSSAGTDGFGRLRAGALLEMSQQVSELDCHRLGASREDLDKKGLFWAIVRNRIAVTQLPKAGQRITLKTWPLATTRTAYPRITEARDEEGNLLFACHSLWILMDRTTRALVLPEKSGLRVAGVEGLSGPPAPKSLGPMTPENRLMRTVTEDDLDRNGHMNNGRYLGWVEALLPATSGAQYRLKEATLCYSNEALLGQTLEVLWSWQAENLLQVELMRENPSGKQDKIFRAQLEYEKDVL